MFKRVDSSWVFKGKDTNGSGIITETELGGEDLNGDGVIGGDDYQIIGTGIPEQLFGWNNNLFFHGFTMNIFFQSMGGYDKWNFNYGNTIGIWNISHLCSFDNWCNISSKI